METEPSSEHLRPAVECRGLRDLLRYLWGVLFAIVMIPTYSFLNEAEHSSLQPDPQWNEWIGCLSLGATQAIDFAREVASQFPLTKRAFEIPNLIVKPGPSFS